MNTPAPAPISRLITIRRLIIACAIFWTPALPAADAPAADRVHTPEVGSAERAGILEALHAAYTTGSGKNVKFLVHHFKVHHGWAWINVVPLDKSGTPEGEEWPSLLRQANGKWVIIDLIAIAEKLDDPVGPAEPSAKFIKAVQTKYPGVPEDVFPRPAR